MLRPGVLGRRACAALAAASAGLHAAMIGQGNPVAGVAMVAMAAGCLYCARDLWTGASLRAWLLVALMNLGMIAVHLPLLDCRHAASTALVLTPTPPPLMTGPLMTVATALALLEAAIAAVVLYVLTRNRAERLGLR